jgi:hypothetical protein
MRLMMDPMGMMEMSPGELYSKLVAGLIFGVIAVYLFREGRKRVNYTWIFVGVALFVYMIFTTSVWQDWGIGIALTALAYYRR